MNINEIVFNPYDENDGLRVERAIHDYLNKTQPEIFLEEIAKRSYFDTTIGWNTLFIKLFENNKLLNLVQIHYIKLIDEERTDVLSVASRILCK